jgi:hypothetical protein
MRPPGTTGGWLAGTFGFNVPIGMINVGVGVEVAVAFEPKLTIPAAQTNPKAATINTTSAAIGRRIRIRRER